MIAWMIDTLVATAALMLLVLLIRRPVARHFGARAAYLLWALPALRLVLPPFERTVLIERGAAAPVELPGLTGGAIATASPAVASATDLWSLADLALPALILWLGGAAILLTVRLGGYFQFRRDVLGEGVRIGTRAGLRLIESGAVQGPVAFGLFARYIALPADFAHLYSPRERELAITHEVTHHKRGDIAANFVGLALLCLHWFNPVAWMAWHAFREDQEAACDACVIEGAGSGDRLAYGRAIAKAAGAPRLQLASPLRHKEQIKRRLRMLAGDGPGVRRRMAGIALTLIAGAGILPLTATVIETPSSALAQSEATPLRLGPDSVSISTTRNDTTGAQRIAIDTSGGKGRHLRTVVRGDKTYVVRTAKAQDERETEQTIDWAMQQAADASARDAELAAQDARLAVEDAWRDAELAKQDARRATEEATREARLATMEARLATEEAARDARLAAAEATRESAEAAREARHNARQAAREAAAALATARVAARDFRLHHGTTRGRPRSARGGGGHGRNRCRNG